MRVCARRSFADAPFIAKRDEWGISSARAKPRHRYRLVCPLVFGMRGEVFAENRLSGSRNPCCPRNQIEVDTAYDDDGFLSVYRCFSFRAAGLDSGGVRTSAGSSAMDVIVVAATGENSIVVVPGANALLTPQDLDGSVEILR